MENRTRRRLIALAAILGGALVIAVVGQGAMILAMGEELRGMRGEGRAAARPVDPAPLVRATPIPSPRAPVDPAFDAMQRMMDQAFGGSAGADPFGDPFALLGAAPGISLDDRGTEYVVSVEMPGDDAGKVDVKVDGRTLTVRDTHSSQSLELPGPVDAPKMRATRDGGVLTLVLPKSADG
jgi:HSP20 family molecular chaperone IbpA